MWLEKNIRPDGCSRWGGVPAYEIKVEASGDAMIEVEASGDPMTMSKCRRLNAHLSDGKEDETIENVTIEAGSLNLIMKTSEQNENYGASGVTLSSSGSSPEENSSQEHRAKDNRIHLDQISYFSSLNNNQVPYKTKANISTEGHHKSQWEVLAGSEDGTSTGNSSQNFRDTFARERLEHASDDEIKKLEAEAVALSRKGDISESESQTLRKQVVKEAVSLGAERDATEEECEKLKTVGMRLGDTKTKDRILQPEVCDLWAFCEQIQEELYFEKDMNANLRIQLHKIQESNSELILDRNDIDAMLNQKNKRKSNHPSKYRSSENAKDLKGTISGNDKDEDEEQKTLEELIKGHRDVKDKYLLEQKIIDLYSEIEAYKRDKDELEIKMEQLALDYEILKQENHDFSQKLEQSQLQKQLKFHCKFPSYFANTDELERKIESLENQLNEQSEAYSNSLDTIDELKKYVKILEEELKNQVQLLETDTETSVRAKFEQEQRSICAEEALQMARLKNANTVERLQEEFTRLSVQITSTFYANEKVATKASMEATELRIEKNQIKELLKTANEELLSVKEEYEVKLSELSTEVDQKVNQMKLMREEINNKSELLECQKMHEEEVREAFSREIFRLEAENEKLTAEKKFLSQQAEQKENLRLKLRHMKASSKQTELLLQRRNIDRNELVITIALMKKEVDNLLKELKQMRQLKNQETLVQLLQSELDMTQVKCTELKSSLIEHEVEKDELQQQVFQLKGDLQKKEDLVSSMEKKLKNKNARAVVSEGVKTCLRNNKSAPPSCDPKGVASLKERVKLLEGQIRQKESALETSTNLFLEKEKDLQKKIDELEKRMEEFNQHSTNFSALQKVTNDATEVCEDDARSQEFQSMGDHEINITGTSKENGNVVPFIQSNKDRISDQEIKGSVREQNHEELYSALTSLKERNICMENELKDMEDRYSEMSLKFAEVEGERQQLIMTVRNLKIAMKM